MVINGIKNFYFHFFYLVGVWGCPPNLILAPNNTICSDIGGHFSDLIELGKIAGKPPFTNYLFIGNNVNKGYLSVECISLLLALKVRYPDRISMTRGCMESRI